VTHTGAPSIETTRASRLSASPGVTAAPRSEGIEILMTWSSPGTSAMSALSRKDEPQSS
jgi:hypothetical protein